MENLKSLNVFSKKLNGVLNVFPTKDRLVPALAVAGWTDHGWNNSPDSWLDSGWNNAPDSWSDSGWNNSPDSWSDSGWNNSPDTWSDSGWSNSSDGGGCYITTATVEYMGLSDDCEELNLLRMFRDKLVEEDPEFRKIVLEYYKTAPQIVEKIAGSSNKDAVLKSIYANMVLPVVDLLRKGKIAEAQAHYINFYNELKSNYISSPQKRLDLSIKS